MIMTVMLLAFVATAAEPSRLTSVKAMFDSGIKQLEAEHKQKVKLYSQKYLAELDRIQTASTRAGDLDGALQVRAEILRVKQPLAGKTPAVRVVVPTAAQPPAGKVDPIVGKWEGVRVEADGAWLSAKDNYQSRRRKWRHVKGRQYKLYLDKLTRTVTLSENNNALSIAGEQGEDLGVITRIK